LSILSKLDKYTAKFSSPAFHPASISVLRFVSCAACANYVLSQTLSTGALVTNFYSNQPHFYHTSYFSDVLLPTRYSDDFTTAGVGFLTLRIVSYLRALVAAALSVGITGSARMIFTAFTLAGYILTTVHER